MMKPCQLGYPEAAPVWALIICLHRPAVEQTALLLRRQQGAAHAPTPTPQTARHRHPV